LLAWNANDTTVAEKPRRKATTGNCQGCEGL